MQSNYITYCRYRVVFSIMKSTMVLVFLLLSLGASAQLKERIDSLHNEVVKASSDSAKCDILIQIAEEYRFVNSDSAILYVDKAKAAASQLKSDYLTVNIAIQNAIILYEKGDYENSISQLQEIDSLVTELDDKRYLLKVYQTYGNSFGLSNEHRKAIEYELKALDYAKALKDSMAMAHLYINIGSDFHYIREYQKGIEYCNNARQIYAKLGHDFYQGFALNNMSNYSNHLKDYRKALEYATEASLYWNETNNERLMAYLYHNYGKAYKGLKDYSQSEKYYLKSVAIRKKNEDPKDLCITNNELADLYVQWDRLSAALSLAQRNYSMAKEKSFTREEQQAASILATIYERKGNLEQTVNYLKINQQLKDSLQTIEQAKEVLRLQTKYQNAEKENLILQQRNKITANQLALKNRNFWIFGLSSLTVIIGLIGFLLYKQQVLKNIKQQQENEMRLTLEKIENHNKLQDQRLAISRDLHDNIGAQLTFIISAIDTIKYYIKGKDERLIGKLENIGVFAKETIQELRDTIWAMNKSGITIMDLQTRIANFIEKAEQSLRDVTISVFIDDGVSSDLAFTALQGLNIFRIIQEAINNALKYAEARHILIRIQKEADIRFIISDDGKGFQEKDEEQGNGLLNMRKRALELGHELVLQSEPGKGTSIAFSVAEL